MKNKEREKGIKSKDKRQDEVRREGSNMRSGGQSRLEKD